MENRDNNEFETKEQYHARCEERRRLAAERSRRQHKKMAVLVGGTALLFVAVTGSVIGIRGAVASARSAGSDAATAAVSETADTQSAPETVIADDLVPANESADTDMDISSGETADTEGALTAEVSEFDLSEGPVEAGSDTEENAPSTDAPARASESTTLSASTGADNSYVPLSPTSGDDLLAIPEEVISEHAVLISLSDEKVLADLGMNDRISPASMTKVLTLLTAVENLPETWQEDTFTMTIDITDYSYVNDCSNVGFEVGEEIPVKDLLYGTILPSGADAALGLAHYISGSQEAFVELMNRKLAELGLSDSSHFTNCIGLYHEDHYTTCRDMAVIMKAAMDNPLCREVLSTHVYTTAPTTPHPDGLILSNWFLRRIEDKDCGGFVVGAKTGFVVQSKCCAVSLAQGPDQQEYILVTAGSTSSWRAIYDQVAIYKAYFSTITAEDAPADQ